MTTPDTNAVSMSDGFFASPPTTLAHHPPPAHSLWNPHLRPGGERRASFSWTETWEVDRVERVLTPLFVTLTAMSNLVLLGHEARVVWRTQTLIPPKLLVLALSSADLLATLVGYLPLWVLVVLCREQSGGSPVDATKPPPGSRSSLQPGSHTSLPSPTLASHGPISAETATSGLLGNGIHDGQPVVHTMGYCVALFLFTAFWTLAQCIVVVMGVERFLALRAPYFYAARCTWTAFLAVVGLLTVASCGVAGFRLAVHLEEVHRHPLEFAGFTDSGSLAYNVFTLVQGLTWTVVLLLCNWAVTRELRRMEQSVTVMRMKDQQEYMKQLSMVHGAGRDFARFMMAVNALFLLSACPNLVCVLLRLCGSSPRFSIQFFCWRMSHISALLNPFLYGFLRKSLRSRIRRFLNQHVPCMRPHRIGDEDPDPSVRYENQDIRHHMSPSSAIMPRDPEASIVHISD